VDVLLPLDARTVLGFSYQILTSLNCKSQLTQMTKQQIDVKVYRQSVRLGVKFETYDKMFF
jgi:hypothetical protein